MTSAYQQLFVGLAAAIVLIYLLIVINFQSWIDPFVIVMALPTALAGIVWMLFGDRNDAFGSRADRRDHVHGGGDRQQHSGDQFCPRTDGGRRERHRQRHSRRAVRGFARC